LKSILKVKKKKYLRTIKYIKINYPYLKSILDYSKRKPRRYYSIVKPLRFINKAKRKQEKRKTKLHFVDD